VDSGTTYTINGVTALQVSGILEICYSRTKGRDVCICSENYGLLIILYTDTWKGLLYLCNSSVRERGSFGLPFTITEHGIRRAKGLHNGYNSFVALSCILSDM
jgi:hypothetical protein